MIGPIKTVGIYVDDQDKAKSFWIEKLGFTLRREMSMGPYGKWVEVSPTAAETSFVIYPKTMMEDWSNHKPSIVFHCPDVVGTVAALRETGVEIKMTPTDMPWGKFATFCDPDGNEFGLTSQELA